MDSEKKLKEKIDQEVKRQEEELSHQSATTEEPPTSAGENKEEISKKIEYSASLEVQQQNRPLAALQKHFHDQRLLIDDDDELYHLKDTLVRIHDKYYNVLKKDGELKADIKLIMPAMKQNVLDNCRFVFSGLIPLGTDIQRADIVIWTNTFGAISTSDIDEKTTHVITKTPGTYKARLAKSFNPKIKILHPDWVFECLTSWKHVDEKPYELIVEQPVSETELEEFKKKLAKRQLLATANENLSPANGTNSAELELFSGGMSWLDDDEGDILDSDEEEEEDAEEEDEEQEDGEGQNNKEENMTNGKNTRGPTKRLHSDYNEEAIEAKKVRPSKEEEEEESDSDLEDELMNMLDS